MGKEQVQTKAPGFGRTKVLMFNPSKILSAVFASQMAAAKVFGCSSQTITMACNGTTISTHGFYFRSENKEVNISFDMMGRLTLQEYDDMCGVERKVYKTTRMDRTGEKYQTEKRKANHERYLKRKTLKAVS